MIISTASVFVTDQQKALDFYTRVLGFVEKTNIPLGDFSWLTVVSTAHPDGVELLLEPNEHPAAKAFTAALVEDGLPFTSFSVEDAVAEAQRLTGLGVVFVQEPVNQGPVTTAIFDDTVGNLIQIASTN